ncbi:hypothetical protein CI610_02690 [invertebrate metagenome]|uniref:EamA domain-containing protein n=1 Tax=invertebrate metagenome TaxID=1711999 RepID=A0A2H9T582_9ZZZZ
MKTQTKACLYALATAFLWSTIATAFKLALDQMDSWQLLFWSTSTSLLLLASITIISRQTIQTIRSACQHPFHFLWLGLLNPLLYHLVLFSAYERLPAQQAQAINYSWPVMMTLLAIPFLKQTLTLRSLLCCLTAYAGVLVICFQSNVTSFQFNSLSGVILALASTVIWAMYWIINVRKSGNVLNNLFLCFLFGYPFVVLATCRFSTVWPISPEGLSAAIYIGCIEMGFAYVLWIKALKLTTHTAIINNISYLSPFLSLLFIHFVLGEDILPSTYMGLLLIISAIIIQQKKRKHAKE